MTMQTTNIRVCDRCGEIMKPENGGAGFSYFYDFEEEDGGFEELNYEDLCLKCVRPLMRPLTNVVETWEKEKKRG